MIYFRNVSLSFLDKKLFDNINWTIHPKSRIGLVGENGTGKTTLFRAILDQVHLDSGMIDIPGRKQKVFGYLPQDLVELESVPLIDFLKKKSGIAAIEESIKDLEHQLSQVKQNTSEYSDLSQKYSDALAHFSAMDGYAFEARAKQVLKGFGFKESDFNQRLRFIFRRLENAYSSDIHSSGKAGYHASGRTDKSSGHGKYGVAGILSQGLSGNDHRYFS